MRFKVLLLMTTAACAPAIQPLPRTAELPPLPVEQVSIISSVPGQDQLGGDQPRVTLNASRADVRVLIPALAEIAGVSVVMDSTVRGTVAVRFENVLAIDALRAVIESANMGIDGGPDRPWAESEFRDLPVNINSASAGIISARFRVSPKLASWIVSSREIAIPER